ncbi:MAG: ribonuclease P protein component [Desulfobaccales bacterium]
MSHPTEHSRGSVSIPPCPSPGTARFTKEDRLLRRAEFLRAIAQGRRLHTRHFSITLAPAPAGRPRLGLVVTKRMGKAVRRNRVRRLLREFFRLHRDGLPPEDIIIMAKKGAPTLDYHQVQEELSRVLLTRVKGK